MKDDELHRILRRTTRQTRLPDTFNSDVWHRIEAEESISLGTCLNHLCQSLLTLLARPCPAAAVIIASMAMGAWLGMQAAEPVLDGASAYVLSIDPQMRHHMEVRP